MSKNNIDFKNFKGIDIQIDKEKLRYSVKQAGNKMVKNLNVMSPKGKNHRAKKYAETWESLYDSKELEAVVWNRYNYRLTHLLEHGHLNVNVKGGIGWVAPRPHIRQAYAPVEQYFEERMKKIGLEAHFE